MEADVRSTIRTLLVSIGNEALMVAYASGGLVVLFPQEYPIPQSMGGIAIGMMLLATALFGSPYFSLDGWGK